MNIFETVRKALKENGYDGLVIAGQCGCLINGLSPGNCLNEECEFAYKHTHSQIPDLWIMSTKKEGITDDYIEEVINNL